MSGTAGGAQTLQDFLISINYQINEASQNKVSTGLKQSTYLAVEAGKAFVRLAEEVWRSAHEMAQAMDQLYFASQRTGASVESLNALTYAARQLGSSAAGAAGTVENIAKLMATNPAGEGFLNSLGVRTRDANHQLIETGRIVEGLGETFKKMPLWQANVVGNMLGIDYRTLLAMREGLGRFGDEYRDLQHRMHLDSDQLGRDANAVGTEYRRLGAVFETIGNKIKLQFMRPTAETMRQLRNFLVAHFDDIAAIVEWCGGKIILLTGIMERLAGRGLDAVRSVHAWFGNLDDRTQTLIKTFGALLLGWRLLNTAFMMSPIGRIITLALALGLLWDDYKTWKEGGQSLIDWEKWELGANKAIEIITNIKTQVRDFFLELAKTPDFQDLKTSFVELLQSFIPLKDAIVNDLVPAVAKLIWTLAVELVRVIREDVLPALDDLGVRFAGMGPKMFSGGSVLKDLREFIGLLKSVVTYLTNVVELYSALANRDWTKALAIAQRIKDNLFSGLEEHRNPDEATPREMGGVVSPDPRNWWQRTMPTWAGGRNRDGSNPTHPDAGVPVDKRAGALEAFDFWKGQGYTDPAAAVMAAAEERESGHNPAARGDLVNGVPTAHGLYQHHEDRRRRILAETGIDMSTASAADQRKAVAAEIRLGLDPQAGKVYEPLRTAQTFQEAADAEVGAGRYSQLGVIRPGDRIGAAQADAAKAATILELARKRAVPPPVPVAGVPNVPAGGNPPPKATPTSAPSTLRPPRPLTDAEQAALKKSGNALQSDLDAVLGPEWRSKAPAPPPAPVAATPLVTPKAGPAQAVMQQDIDINIHANQDPEATGAAVERAQRRLNADAVRNLQGALQ